VFFRNTQFSGANSAMINTDEKKLPILIFWVAAFVLLFWGLGQKALWGSEDRWAEVVREMLLTGDYFHPKINGVEYFDKPLLSYWFIIIVQAITGRLNELSIRLPSAIAGLLVLWGTLRIGRQLWSEEVGRTAGWLLLTSYALLFWARIAEADMLNLAAIILAVSWYWQRREQPVFLTYLVFYLICFTGAHTKGLAAVIVPVLALLPDLLRESRWKTHLNRGNFLALLVGGILYIIPFIIANSTNNGYQSSGLYLVFHENILRYFQAFDHKEPFYVYFIHVPTLLLPWAPLFFGALCSGRELLATGDKKTRWLVETIIVIFVFFSLSGSRRNYYILPIIPFCALYISVFLQRSKNKKLKRFFLLLQIGLLAVISIFELLTPALWGIVQNKIGFIPPSSMATFTPVAGLAALAVWFVPKPKAYAISSFLGVSHKVILPVFSAVILMGSFFCWQHIELDAYRTGKPFALELKAVIDKAKISPDHIAFYGKHTKDIVFYLNQPQPIPMLTTPDEARDFIASRAGVKLIIARRDCMEELVPLLPPADREKPILEQKVYPWEKKRSFSTLVAWEIKSDS